MVTFFFMEISVVTVKNAENGNVNGSSYSKDVRMVDDKHISYGNLMFCSTECRQDSDSITVNNWFIQIFLFRMTNSTLSFELHLDVEKLSLVPMKYYYL